MPCWARPSGARRSSSTTCTAIYPTELPEEAVLGTGDYGGVFPTLVGEGSVIGAQFHPEKSQQAGIAAAGGVRPVAAVTSVRVSLVDCVRPSGSGGRRWSVWCCAAAAGGRCPGSWETVHGHIEAGERPAEAAARELEEETGLVRRSGSTT